MANFVVLDSIWRDRTTYQNPFDYELLPEQVENWFSKSRLVRAFPQNVATVPVDFVSNVNLLRLIVPYDPSLADVPEVFVNFHSKRYADRYLLNTINSIMPTARFVCFFDKIQFNSNLVPTWIHYKTDGQHQVLRFKRDDTIVFQVMTRNGEVISLFLDPGGDIPPNPNQQTLSTFEITPYLRDGDFANWQIEPNAKG